MYAKFLLKINKGNTQYNIVCDRARFVLLVNECKNRWVEKHLKDKDSILIDSLQEIVKSAELSGGSVKPDYVEYPLEDDFYEGILAKSDCEENDCKGVVYSREVKNQNKNILQFDENSKPDFDFEWSFYSIQGNKLRIYKEGFNILKTNFEYYSVLPDFDINGYINIEGIPSTDKALPLSEQYIDQILNVAATEFMRNFENQNGIQTGINREQNQE